MNQEEDRKDDDLMARIEKIKQKRQKEIENDKKRSEINDENDEFISRLSRLKPVEPVPQPDPDIEYMQIEEEIERQKDEYFEKKEKRQRAKRAKKDAIKDKTDPIRNSGANNDQIIDEYYYLYSEAGTLLLNIPRMRKAQFIKKLDIYTIAMRKKSMDPNKYNALKLNIDVMR